MIDVAGKASRFPSMRIAFVVGYFPTPSETFILNQITGLIDRGHGVEVFAHRPGDGAPSAPATAGGPAKVHYWGLPPGAAARTINWAGLMARRGWRRPAITAHSLNVWRYGRLSATLVLPYAALSLGGGRDYDIIQCHFGPNGVLAVALRELGLLHGKIVTTFHGYDVSSLPLKEGPQVYDRLFRQGDLFLPISEAWRRRLIELGCPTERTAVHHMGIDCAKFAFTPRLPRGDGVVRFVSVARLVEKKGIEFAVRASARLMQRGRRIRYDVLGDGPLRAGLERLAAESGVRNAVHFHGWKPHGQVLELLNQGDVFLAPSVTGADGDQEGIPVVLMEAMALGMPVVSTIHSGIPELVENGRSGFLVPERDEHALSEALDRLIAQPALWSQMGAAGRAHVEREFNIERLNDALVQRFQRFIVSVS